MSKITEKVAATQLIEYLDKNNWLSEQIVPHYGDCSTSCPYYDISMAFDNQNSVILLLLDFQLPLILWITKFSSPDCAQF